MLKRNIDIFVRLVLIAILVAFIGIIIAVADDMPADNQSHSSTPTPAVLQKKTPVLFPDIEYSIYYDIDMTKEFLNKVQRSISKLEKHIVSEDYNRKATKAMNKELARLQDIESRVSSDLGCYLTWEEEYYYATKVWEYFRQRGFNNEITCAIIGNMMIETSGGTLDLNPTIYSPSGNYYGLCQWSLKYCPDAKDLPFEQQLDYLFKSMPCEFNTFGKKYKSGFKYEDFLTMTDAEEAALAFAQSYERCSSVSYEMRQEATEKAYEYFNLD